MRVVSLAGSLPTSLSARSTAFSRRRSYVLSTKRLAGPALKDLAESDLIAWQLGWKGLTPASRRKRWSAISVLAVMFTGPSISVGTGTVACWPVTITMLEGSRWQVIAIDGQVTPRTDLSPAGVQGWARERTVRLQSVQR